MWTRDSIRGRPRLPVAKLNYQQHPGRRRQNNHRCARLFRGTGTGGLTAETTENLFRDLLSDVLCCAVSKQNKLHIRIHEIDELEMGFPEFVSRLILRDNSRRRDSIGTKSCLRMSSSVTVKVTARYCSRVFFYFKFQTFSISTSADSTRCRFINCLRIHIYAFLPYWI